MIEGLDILQKFELRDPSDPSVSAETPGTLLQSIEIDTASASKLPTPTPTPEPFSPTMPPTGSRPLSEIEPADRNAYYNTAPAMEIDPKKDYVAVIRTDVGDITIDLFEDDTPNTVNNFVLLALNGFYDGTTFHRVIEDFMAQGGDPTGTGAGGPGYRFADEFVSDAAPRSSRVCSAWPMPGLIPTAASSSSPSSLPLIWMTDTRSSAK